MSQKQLSRLFTLIFVLTGFTGCAQSSVNSTGAAKRWDAQYEHCADIARANTADFPDNTWFDSLTEESKKSVIGYLYNYNQRICTAEQTERLRAAIEYDNNSELNSDYEEILTPLDVTFSDRLEGIEKSEILKIQAQYSEPFSIRHVLTQLDLYPKR
ncbi:hypothetical protein Q4491_08990 [Photobacterium sp. 2_MG-2023]|uniref:hypothetical protein n=1 Tax=Photobacterium sp. 2_MG-2023 TaxID=3062663 RepID=UPI0026E1C82A|nr:hypothetical protein [Photobacterium sp. 2_MG-2023]MDO6581484.1 hypothetical protein [Photobacterium sp. 2_MG-2023]